MTYIPRLIDAELRQALRVAPVVVVEGPRACGKTMSASRVAASAIRLDTDPVAAALADVAPERLLEGATPRLIDEWQEVPSVWDLARRAADEGGEGQFILTGSAVPSAGERRHTGAGRFVHLHMWPLSTREWLRRRDTAGADSAPSVSLSQLLDGSVDSPTGEGALNFEGWVEWLCRGGWPRLSDSSPANAQTLLRSYIEATARRDVSKPDGVYRQPERVNALFAALARNVGTDVSVATLARDTGMARDTAVSYLDALHRVHVMHSQPAWGPHLRSRARVRSHPKLHFADPSLAIAALRAQPSAVAADVSFVGTLFESMVVRDMNIYAQHVQAEVFHYRDSNDLEVDIVVDGGYRRWLAMEVKLGFSQRVVEQAASALHRFTENVDTRTYGEPAALVIVVGGGPAYARPDGILVIPADMLGP